MQDADIEGLRAAIAALEGHRAALGDAVVELSVAPLRARLAALLRPAGLQRRQVAVLFVDVVGSTAMAQALQAEDTLDVLGPALQRMAAIVQAHQGRVLRFTGDGVKAVFGMDEAREDDAERAVRAGLAMLAAGREQAEAAQRLHGVPDFALRVGVHTGDVVLGAGVEADNTAVGAAVNIAARMEQSAPPGALRISHETWSHVRGLFEVEAQPPLQIKGMDAPITTYLVLSAKDRSLATVERGLQGLSTPMVGRQAEWQRLLDTVAQARASRQGQALTLLGEAGLGKSRLLRELRAALGAEDLPVNARPRVLAMRLQPDGQLRPWGLLRSLLAVLCGLADTDSAELARRKVLDGLAPRLGERGPAQASLIGQLAGLDFGDSPQVSGLPPRALRDQAFAALRACLQGLTTMEGAPPVLLVEDLHWADDGSLDWLQDLLAHAAELPIALIMTSRPALLSRHPDWGTPDTRLVLRPLSAAHSAELSGALLQRLEAVPPLLGGLITGQAEGNPYYMEELVRRLIDDRVIETDGPRWTVHAERLGQVQLPGTLVGLLQARLDALPARERHAVRQASVIGAVFWDDALRALDADAPQALPDLERAAFVHAKATSDFEGTAEQHFDHHLLHQVTYDTLLKAERRVGHGAAARWLAERTRGRGAEFLAMTGDHAERAGDTALAVDCFEQAAREAGKRYANTAAVAWVQRALALLGDADPLRSVDLLDELHAIADVVGDRATQDAAQQQAAALLLRHPDDLRQARLWFAMSLLADRRSEAAESDRLARQAFARAERCGAARWAASAQGQLAWLHIARQDYSGAAQHLAIALPWAGRIEAEVQRNETEAQMLTLSGMVSILTCRLNEARRTLMAVLQRGQALGKPRLQLGAMDNLAVVATDLGHWDEVADWGERARALAQSIGARAGVALGQQRLAMAAQSQGDLAAAQRWHGEVLVTMREVGDRRQQAISQRFLAMLHLQQGEVPAALSLCEQALELHAALDEALEAVAISALAALCEARLGRRTEALLRLDALLVRLGGELADRPAHETIATRWSCQQAFELLGDARAAPLLEQLVHDVRARVALLTDAADQARLIQAEPLYRDIVAQAGPGGSSLPAG